jgi:EAL domain-containing protein (putative c-di-GMP-specific phosphodiesterase class I)/AmiR/NasT family two-component response regulator
MSELIDTSLPHADAAAAGANVAAATNAPLCWIVDNEPSMRHFLSLTLNGFGIDTLEYADDDKLKKEAKSRLPDLIFLNISSDSSDAISSILMLRSRGYTGSVQLIGRRNSEVLEYVRKIGVEYKLNMLPVLQKPISTETLVKIIHDLKLVLAIDASKQIDLTEALKQNWVEFWYQPVVDLRKKRLASIEAFARARHPQHGVILPGGFLGNATNSSIMTLSELAILSALKAGLKFAKVGVNLPVTVNVPIEALQTLSIERLVNDFHADPRYWPGLIIDVPEEQIVSNLRLIDDLSRRLKRVNVKLAVDNFGRSEQPLCSTKELPFAQLKLDRLFVARDQGAANAVRCKTMINLAHNFGTTAVAIGIENAADAMALTALGCDLGQGFLLGQPMAQERFISLLRRRVAIENQSRRRFA